MQSFESAAISDIHKRTVRHDAGYDPLQQNVSFQSMHSELPVPLPEFP